MISEQVMKMRKSVLSKRNGALDEAYEKFKFYITEDLNLALVNYATKHTIYLGIDEAAYKVSQTLDDEFLKTKYIPMWVKSRQPFWDWFCGRNPKMMKDVFKDDFASRYVNELKKSKYVRSARYSPTFEQISVFLNVAN